MRLLSYSVGGSGGDSFGCQVLGLASIARSDDRAAPCLEPAGGTWARGRNSCRTAC